jgi:hypothetical protein
MSRGEGSLAFRNASSSRDRRRVGQCKRRQRARPRAAPTCSGSQAVNNQQANSAAVIQNCMEGLELPGEPSDYHFLIQGSANELWRRRRDEPSLIEDVERLCWLDLQLVEARPDCVTFDHGEGPHFFGIQAFGMLIGLFEQEGALYEALEIAERADRFGQGSQQREQLAERIAAVENEARG